MPDREISLGIGGRPAPAEVVASMQLLEVEEHADQPGTMLLRLPVNYVDTGELQFVGDGTFEPLTRVSLVVSLDGTPQCVFDGYVLSWRVRFDRVADTSMIEIWAHDASWRMNVKDSVRQWPGVTDSDVARQIFSSYGWGVDTDNDSSPVHGEDAHTLFQRSTDLQFLRALARRGGKVLRVGCDADPGFQTGHFVTPAATNTPAATITMGDPERWSVDSMEFEWDVMRPTTVTASQLPLDDATAEPVTSEVSNSGITAMAARGYPAYVGHNAPSLRLTATADAPELAYRARGALADAQWFARCRGEAELGRLGVVMRVGTTVAIDGAGGLNSGTWLVWSVIHRVTAEAHALHFTLVRNAIGLTL